MGSGGSHALGSPGEKGVEVRCGEAEPEPSERRRAGVGCWRIKPHGRLVRVGCTRYRASTATPIHVVVFHGP